MLADKERELAALRAEIEELKQANHKLLKVSLQAIHEASKHENQSPQEGTEGKVGETNRMIPSTGGYFDKSSLKEIGLQDTEIEEFGNQIEEQPKKKTKKDKVIEEAEMIADRLIRDTHKYEEAPEVDFNFHNSSQLEEQKNPVKKYDVSRFKQPNQNSEIMTEKRNNYSSMLDESQFNTSKISKKGANQSKQKVSSLGPEKQLAGPSREAISLIFHYTSLGYKTSNFLVELRELTRNLQKVFNANMGELIIVDSTMINIMADADGQGVSKLKEEMADSTEVLVIRTSVKMHGYQKVDEAASSTLTTMCNEINVMKFKRRIVFKRGKLLAPISITFGPESKKLTGRFTLKFRSLDTFWGL